MAISPEVISTMGDPWKLYGTSLPSIRSRIPANMIIAMVKPTAVPNPLTTLVTNPYSFCTLVNATPSTAQLVVIRGR